MSTTDTTHDKLENKKRKAEVSCDSANTTITSHFPVEPKTPKSPPMLKDGRYTKSTKPREKDADLMDEV